MISFSDVRIVNKDGSMVSICSSICTTLYSLAWPDVDVDADNPIQIYHKEEISLYNMI